MELDFFKYAQGGPSKRKSTTEEPENKKRKVEVIEGGEADPGGEDEDAQSRTKHRVIAKGSDVPECIETFAALKDRYSIPSHLLANLSQNGYAHPTAIQCYGIPILLEVGKCTPLTLHPLRLCRVVTLLPSLQQEQEKLFRTWFHFLLLWDLLHPALNTTLG